MKELDAFVKEIAYDESFYISSLINDEFLRSKWVRGMEVVFPTEKLFQYQKIPTYTGISSEKIQEITKEIKEIIIENK